MIGVIFVLINQSDIKKAAKNNSVIFNFDKADLDRIDKMVTRFNGGKGDNLMIIDPTMDSGSVIHDVISNGKEIKWIVDNSRDAWYPNNKDKTEYVCKSIRIHERDSEFIDVQLSKCKNYKEDEQLSIITFLKDQL